LPGKIGAKLRSLRKNDSIDGQLRARIAKNPAFLKVLMLQPWLATLSHPAVKLMKLSTPVRPSLRNLAGLCGMSKIVQKLTALSAAIWGFPHNTVTRLTLYGGEMFNNQIRRASILLALSLVLSACQQPGATSLATPPSPTSAPSLAQPSAPQTPKQLTIGMTEEPDTLNMHRAQLFTSYKVAFGVFDTLIRFDTALVLQPSLAESWTISDDRQTYMFRLRKGVKWHDGAPFTAQDVVATWKVITDPNFGAFVTTGWDSIASIDTPDDFTLVVKTKTPVAAFLNNMAFTVISPKHWIDRGEAFKNEFGRKPIGTGPYKLLSWSAGEKIELESNVDYFLGKPDIDRITVKFVPSSTTLANQLRTGEVQMSDALGAPEYEQVRAIADSETRLLTSNNWMQIELKNIDFLMDKRVRQALDFATPKQEIVDQILKGLGVVAVADQSPALPYHNASIQLRALNLQQAESLLTEAGFARSTGGVWEKDGRPLKIEYWITTGDQTLKLVGQAVAASWRKLGVDVVEREIDMRNVGAADSYFYDKSTMTAGQYDWYNQLDPDTRFFWHSDFIPREAGGGGGNSKAFFNKLGQQDEFDRLLDAGAVEFDQAKRVAIYHDVQALLHEETPVIFLYWPKRIFVAPKRLQYETNAALPLLFNAYSWKLP
jgi:peptide/nickel transport system substrate-binding protein